MTTINKTSNSVQVVRTPHNQLVDIFEKVKRGVGLSASEKGFLAECSQTAPSLCSKAISWICTPADEDSVQKTNSLVERMLKREVPALHVFQEVKQRLQATPLPTVREIAALATQIGRASCRERV